MFPDRDLQVHFFLEFSFEAFQRAFAEFKPATGEFGIIAAPNELIAYQYFVVRTQQNPINSQVKHIKTISFS
jgi:hypothetical protein